MKIIYIAGIDGSGKTTLCNTVVQRLRAQNVPVRYFYARHFPILLLPLKLIAKVFFLHRLNQHKEYDQYIEKKQEQSQRHSFFAKVYAAVWMLDYVLVTYIRLLPFLFSKNLILDRYFYDVAVNISITLKLSDGRFTRFVRRWESIFPSPAESYYLDLSAETAYERKGDIQSVQYLEERRERYSQLSTRYGWHSVDASQPPEAVANDVMKRIIGTL